MDDQQQYINATQEAGKEFFLRKNQGKFIMLNQLKFKEIADYSSTLDIAPANEISGKEAYDLYIKHTLPFLEEAGSKVLFQGTGNSFLIGPSNEKWDLVLLVEHQSVAKFMEFAQNQEYLKVAGHRIAALEDSRLLPLDVTE